MTLCTFSFFFCIWKYCFQVQKFLHLTDPTIPTQFFAVIEKKYTIRLLIIWCSHENLERVANGEIK